MRKKRFLAAILLSLSFCFVSGLGYGKTDQVLIINKVLGAEVILAIASIALVIATVIHIVIVRRLTLQSNNYLKISRICAEIGIRVPKRSQLEADVTKIRLKRIELEANKKLTPEIKRKLDYREKQCSDTIKKIQNEIDNLEKKLIRLEGKLENG